MPRYHSARSSVVGRVVIVIGLSSLALLLGSTRGRRLSAQDCDGDGTPDRDELVTRLAFSEPVRIVVGDEPSTLRAADLDGDGVDDLVVTNTKSNSISVLLSSQAEDGQLLALASELCVGVDPRGVDVGDVDRDGALDIVCGVEERVGDDPGTARTRVVLLRGDGDGGFTPDCGSPCDVELEARCDQGVFRALEREADAIRSVLLVDLERDGDLDVVTGFRAAPNAGLVSVLLGDGEGGLAAPFEPFVSPLGESRYIAIGDVDANGSPDLLSAGGDLLANLVARGEPRVVDVDSFVEIERDPKGIAIADVTGDGIDDVLISHAAGVLAGPGGGGLAVLRGDGRGGFRVQPQAELLALCDVLESVAVADLDDDGDRDVVVTISGRHPDRACRDPGVLTLVNDGRGFFEPSVFVAFEERRPRWLDVADFDGDGRPDIAVALDDFTASRDEVALILNSSTVPADTNRNGLPDGCEFFRGDFDRDRRVSITDAIGLLEFLFRGGPAPGCLESADADDDGAVNLSDAVRILGFLFRGARPLNAPRVPRTGECEWPSSWVDESGQLACELGCAT